MRNYRFIQSTIPPRKYISLIEELLTCAKVCGVKVKFEKLPPLSGEYVPNNVSGECKPSKITIRIYGKPTDTQVLFTLAHEIRHAQHRKYNMFGNYYKYTTVQTTLRHLRENLLAERECDSYAVKWLKSKGIVVVLNGLYKAEDTNLIRWLRSNGVSEKVISKLCEAVEKSVGGRYGKKKRG